ncbi:helix-turn-helix transcriptional regulator [Achromobacter sp. SD115]|uniref:helix-turn-helix domain-containing protein n=1 Tax=Achromobacter sp. SD115 TaxID=2782011 RepID=UPI001A965A45|nr:helix-turn-helix transcriptional regulator [Achromobacter sp. SD115]MBO1013476.1 helix-turn-helix transcriptional regulator [Achromobacter sp. SD115]
MTTPLRMAREKRGLTIQQVATSVDIDPGNLSRIERGKQVPSKDLAEKLSQVYGGEVTETQIIYPERFACVVPGEAESATGVSAPRLDPGMAGHA